MAGLGYYIPREAPGQLYLAAAVTEWLSMANIRPILRWSVYTSDEPSILLVGGSPTCVFGPLGVQLMLAVNRAQSVTLCSGCGNLYLRQGRKPQAGRHNYCPTCGERVANRDRQRALQARRRQGEQTQTLRDKANQQTSAGKHEWGRA